MRGKPKKTPRQKDLTSDYLSESLDEDRIESHERFTDRAKHQQRDKTLRTANMRLENSALSAEMQTFPVGQVVQVFSVYCDVEHEDRTYLCVIRKTLTKVHGDIVVGDRVRFRPNPTEDSARPGKPSDSSLGPSGLHARAPEAVIEQILPRDSLLTRADSFKARQSHPIVANAQQVLIVASLHSPRPKWGLIDRMIVAARAGNLVPIVRLNKIDLENEQSADADGARAVLEHYASIGIDTMHASAEKSIGIDELHNRLKDRVTVLAGHSGVGKSSLIRAVEPALDIRVGEVSRYTEKGRHTTTSARRYPLTFGGAVVDTPGVKLFGLWNVTRENLIEHFPDVESENAPQWRVESYQRILESLNV